MTMAVLVGLNLFLVSPHLAVTGQLWGIWLQECSFSQFVKSLMQPVPVMLQRKDSLLKRTE